MSLRRDIRRAGESPGADLWPRLHARLANADAPVALEMPPVTWDVLAAGALAVLVLALVPDPGRFLAACGLL